MFGLPRTAAPAAAAALALFAAAPAAHASVTYQIDGFLDGDVAGFQAGFVAGELAAVNKVHAPFFEFIVLEGRSLAQRQRLLKDFTELLVEVLGVRREHVRGACRLVRPEDWAIGGEPASALRKDEIAARAAPASGQMP